MALMSTKDGDSPNFFFKEFTVFVAILVSTPNFSRHLCKLPQMSESTSWPVELAAEKKKLKQSRM